ncbi:class I SAM-dependent methyltransferase [Paenibacillus sp. NPDC058174]|uniref:class I SAM-dependent methyltransferase n=1 Tax=Paenibacillus sp. NPDC058174 TaxID=3346366 RepID=UPI0036DA385F
MNDFYNEAIWEQAWKDQSDIMLKKMQKAGIDFSRSFDPKARAFNEQSFSEEGRKRSRRIINWLEGQGVRFENSSVLDIGAASGVFTVPFAERGARVTALESSPPLVELLEENLAKLADAQVSIVHEPFEHIDVQDKGWDKAFDLVFVSMCPVIHDWESVEKVLACARKYCYISMPVTHNEHSLLQEIWPLITGQPYKKKPLEMGYLLHLLYMKGYSYESLLTREMKTKEVTREAALQEVMSLLGHYGLPVDERTVQTAASYLEKAYPSGKVTVQEGGRFGKVLIRLEDESMYSKED